jgi:hypothetical protein
VKKDLSQTELEFIREAYRYIENPSFLVKATESLKSPIDRGISALPQTAQKAISTATERALKAALQTALFSLKSKSSSSEQPFETALRGQRLSDRLHGAATLVTGAAGGMFGFASLPVELPLTTTLMLRSIAQIASSFGADLNDPKTQLDCLFVLSAGSNYYSTRISFSLVAKEALTFLANRGAASIAEILLHGGSPVLIRLLSMIAARFQMVVTEKIVAQSVPVVGAFAGGAINFAFTDHFNKLAKYHFGLKKLESIYGEDVIRGIYDSNSAQRA